MKLPGLFVESASFCQVYPSEYAYKENSVYGTERDSANCRNYITGPNEDYIHCDGTQLRLSDSEIGSQQFTPSDYYVWLVHETRKHQLLFIFPTRIHLTMMTLHYYSTSGRGLPRVRFYAVPDDFDVWDAPLSSYDHVDIAAVPPVSGHRNNITRSASVVISIMTTKLLLVKFGSSFTFTLSEVEFFGSICSSRQVSTSALRVPTKASVYLTTDYATSTFGKIELESRKTSEF